VLKNWRKSEIKKERQRGRNKYREAEQRKTERNKSMKKGRTT